MHGEVITPQAALFGQSLIFLIFRYCYTRTIAIPIGIMVAYRLVNECWGRNVFNRERNACDGVPDLP